MSRVPSIRGPTASPLVFAPLWDEQDDDEDNTRSKQKARGEDRTLVQVLRDHKARVSRQNAWKASNKGSAVRLIRRLHLDKNAPRKVKLMTFARSVRSVGIAIGAVPLMTRRGGSASSARGVESELDWLAAAATNPQNGATPLRPELASLTIPTSAASVLLPHQLDGVCFLIQAMCGGLNGALLADFMGLGKTTQCVAAISLLCGTTPLRKTLLGGRDDRALRVLVLAPNGVCPHWLTELQRWSATIVQLGYERLAPATNEDEQLAAKTVANSLRCGGNGSRVQLFADMSDISDEVPCGLSPVHVHVAGGASSARFRESWASPDVGGVLVMPYSQFRIGALDAYSTAGCCSADLVILDEGHVVRRCDTKLTIALSALSTPRRIVCSGYPLQNNLDEFYLILDFLSSGRTSEENCLGSRRQFTWRFRDPIMLMLSIAHRRALGADITPEELWALECGQLRTLLFLSLVQPFVLRRGLRVLIDYASPRAVVEIIIRPSAAQRRAYGEFCVAVGSAAGAAAAAIDDEAMGREEEEVQHAMAEIGSPAEGTAAGEMPDVTSVTALKGSPGVLVLGSFLSRLLLMPLRQARQSLSKERVGLAHSALWKSFATRSEALFTSDDASPKMRVLFALLWQARRSGAACIVFSQYLDILSAVEAHNASHPELVGEPGAQSHESLRILRCDGGVDVPTRVERCAAFNDGHADVLLFSLRAGCEGLNLIGASVVISLDPSWNPAIQQESFARAYRIGQTRPVEVVTLRVDGSLEAFIYDLQERKCRLAKLVIDGITRKDDSPQQQQQQQQGHEGVEMLQPASIRLADVGAAMLGTTTVEEASKDPFVTSLPIAADGLPPHSFVNALLDPLHVSLATKAMVKAARVVDFDEVPSTDPPIEAFARNLRQESYFTREERQRLDEAERLRRLLELAKESLRYDRMHSGSVWPPTSTNPAEVRARDQQHRAGNGADDDGFTMSDV